MRTRSLADTAPCDILVPAALEQQITTAIDKIALCYEDLGIFP